MARTATQHDKRQPTLADQFVHSNERFKRPDYQKLHDWLKPQVRNAHKYVFDAAASARMADIVYTVPDLLARELQFARPPYEHTWIEYNARAFFDQSEEHGMQSIGPRDTADKTVGYLYLRNRVFVFAQSAQQAHTFQSPMVSPIIYDIHSEWDAQSQIEFGEATSQSRIGLDQFLWGSSYQHIHDENKRVLRDNTVIALESYVNNAGKDDLQRLFSGSVGDCRNLYALLLILNRPSIIQYRRTLPHQRMFLRNRLVPFMSHTEVEISLDAPRILQLTQSSADRADIRHRRHEVAGHYCHDKTARDYQRLAGCIHDWRASTASNDQDSIGPTRWNCVVCGGKRWWRRSHERGDASIGCVVKRSYNVTE